MIYNISKFLINDGAGCLYYVCRIQYTIHIILKSKF